METGKLPDLLTVKQAAKVLGVHPNTLRNWDRKGKLKAMRVGTRRDRRFRREDILALAGKSPSKQTALADVAKHLAQPNSALSRSIQALNTSLIEAMRPAIEASHQQSILLSEAIRLATMPALNLQRLTGALLLTYQPLFDELAQRQAEFARVIGKSLTFHKLQFLKTEMLVNLAVPTRAMEMLADAVAIQGEAFKTIYDQSFLNIQSFQDFASRMAAGVEKASLWQHRLLLESIGVAGEVLRETTTNWQKWPRIQVERAPQIELVSPNLYPFFESEVTSRDWEEHKPAVPQLRYALESLTPIVIAKMTLSIAKARFQCNRASMLSGGEPLFRVTSETELISAQLPQLIASNEEIFARVLDALYKYLYESSRKMRRIRKLLRQEGRDLIEKIKILRGYFRHDPEMEEQPIAMRNISAVGAIFFAWIGKPYPECSSDWIMAHLHLMREVQELMFTLRKNILK